MLVISAILTFLVSSTVAVSPQVVDWISPPPGVGPGAVDTVPTYNAVDTLNASWSSNLDFDPYLVVWCLLHDGWTANQSGSVPPNGWHLVPLNLGLAAPYPITCHLAFDDQHHTALTTNSSNSGTFNITNVSDQNPQVYGAGDSLVAPSTASAGTAPTGTETADPNSFDSGGGLSDGDIAGIVVGTVLGLGVVVGLFVFFCLRRRRRLRHYKAERWEAVPTTAPAAPEDMQKTEYTQNAEDDIVRELDGEERNRTSELPTEVQKGRK